MMFIAHIKFYSEYSTKENQIESRNCFVPGNDMCDVIHMMEDYYGKNDIEEITIKAFSPDNFLEFTEEDRDLFSSVQYVLGKEVVW